MKTRTSYREYISSKSWLQRRKAFLAKHDSCERCEVSRFESLEYYDQDFHVHHQNYQRVGCELDSDLEALCCRCHEIETFGKTDKQRIGLDRRALENLIDVVVGPKNYRVEPYMTIDGLAGLFL